MTETEHVGRRQLLDALAAALIEEDDIWQIETSSDGSALVARADDQDGLVVAVIEAGSLDEAVTVDDVVRLERLASGVGATAFDGRPAAFLCSRRKPAEGAIQAAYLWNMRILHVRSTGSDTWGRDVAVLSQQEFTQLHDAPVLDEQEWRRYTAAVIVRSSTTANRTRSRPSRVCAPSWCGTKRQRSLPGEAPGEWAVPRCPPTRS
ncbi:hypothetical protein ACU686_15355 [Yinghuangia aomiensis]